MDKCVDSLIATKGSLADVNQLSRNLAHDVNPEQTTVISSENQLDQTLRRPHDLGPWAVLKNPRPTSVAMPCWLAAAAVIPTIAASGMEYTPYGGRGSTVSLNGMPKA